MDIYHLYGKQAEKLEQAETAFRTTLQLLRDLKAGTRTLDEVTVDEDGWKVLPADAMPVKGG